MTTMTTYYVATLARYVLVDAPDEAAARFAGWLALDAMARDEGGSGPSKILTVRPATDDEIDLQRWHDAQVAAESLR
jgi:hypothetical protein